MIAQNNDRSKKILQVIERNLQEKHIKNSLTHNVHVSASTFYGLCNHLKTEMKLQCALMPEWGGMQKYPSTLLWDEYNTTIEKKYDLEDDTILFMTHDHIVFLMPSPVAGDASPCSDDNREDQP